MEFYDQFAKPSEVDAMAFGMTFLDLFAWFCAVVMLFVTLGVFYGLFGKFIPMWKEQRDNKGKKEKAAAEKAKRDKLANDPITKAKRRRGR